MLLKFSRLKDYSLSILIMICCVNSYSQSLLDYETFSIKKDTASLIPDSNKTYLIVLSNNNSCRSCFTSLKNLSETINSRDDKDSVNIKFLCRVENNSRSRKNHINTLKLDIPSIAANDNIYFDVYTDKYEYNKLASSGIFGDYKINKTPAIILYEPGKKNQVFAYDILYTYIKRGKPFSIKELIKFKAKRSADSF